MGAYRLRDVRQRTDRDERHFTRARHDRTNDERHSGLRFRLLFGVAARGLYRRLVLVPATVLPHGIVTLCMHERHVCAHVNRDVGPPRNLQHPQYVGCRALEAFVAHDRRDAEDLELGRLQRQHQRHAVVSRRHHEVGIENDRDAFLCRT